MQLLNLRRPVRSSTWFGGPHLVWRKPEVPPTTSTTPSALVPSLANASAALPHSARRRLSPEVSAHHPARRPSFADRPAKRRSGQAGTAGQRQDQPPCRPPSASLSRPRCVPYSARNGQSLQFACR